MSDIFVPKQVSINNYKLNYNGNNLNVVRVEINKEEYIKCENSSNKMWANKKKGTWGSGYMNTPDDPFRVERTGRLGELAFCKITQSPVDFSYIEFGDKNDTIFRGNTINIKTQMKLYGVIMVRCEMYARPIILNEDIYVFSYLSKDDRKNKKATVDFLGYLLKTELIKKPKVTKEGRGWTNYECLYSELHPISKLFELPVT